MNDATGRPYYYKCSYEDFARMFGNMHTALVLAEQQENRVVTEIDPTAAGTPVTYVNVIDFQIGRDADGGPAIRIMSKHKQWLELRFPADGIDDLIEGLEDVKEIRKGRMN